MDILLQIGQLQKNADDALRDAGSVAQLEALRVSLLGKKGELTGLLRGMGSLNPEDRPRMGQLINEARVTLEEKLNQREMALKSREQEARLLLETIDVTQPTSLPRVGNPHPTTRVLDQVVSCFAGMGFEVVEGPDIELDHYNFELLNIPKNHPARDAQDTFYIDDNIVLRTHTSPVQARTMLTRKPPIRIICPGRCFRADEVDATHSPVFHQIEGLAIDRDVTMADLRGTLAAFARALYGEDIKTRFRPSFFPFTEPSTEVDLTCIVCRGKGCRVCKNSGWVEVLGAGMVNPRVLDACGIDSTIYSGFAFGIGLERITTMRYSIGDMRLLFEGDERFLRQFR
jgi:phenylalanyl-tRNA synthetase alpha chain